MPSARRSDNWVAASRRIERVAILHPKNCASLDAVVLGVRAFNEHKELSANLPRLMTYVENGGTVVVQYNRPNGLENKPLGPYPLSIQGRRSAAACHGREVTGHVPVAGPSRTDDAEQDHGLQISRAGFRSAAHIFPSSWDESALYNNSGDERSGPGAVKSGLLVAKHGSGYFVYTGLSFFRQLPAGVPGAYRFFANLISLGR